MYIIFHFIVDKPDPYVVLRVPGTLNGTKKTKYFNNDSSPTWNEEFAFILDPEKTYHLGNNVVK